MSARRREPFSRDQARQPIIEMPAFLTFESGHLNSRQGLAIRLADVEHLAGAEAGNPLPVVLLDLLAANAGHHNRKALLTLKHMTSELEPGVEASNVGRIRSLPGDEELIAKRIVVKSGGDI